MKKSFLIITFIFLLIPNVAMASTTYVINDKASTPRSCTIKTEPNEGGNFLVPNYVHYLDPGDQITMIDGVEPVNSNNDKCSSKYYYVSYSGHNGYVCGDYILFESKDTYTEELKNEGFPESYITSLNALKNNHPNWIFKAVKTGLKWNDVLAVEGSVGTNYINVKDPNGTDSVYLSLDGGSYDPITQKYIEQEAGGWYAANKDTVAYYLDPRNYLNDRDIYMFESNYYNHNYTDDELSNSISNVFKNNKLNDYTNNFLSTKNIGINPVFVATRSRQEVGVGTDVSSAASGKSGYYNFFNIGAYSSCVNPIYCGNDFASNKGWTTADKAISGGAYWIYTNYTEKNQQTLYFQKFNVNNSGNTYAHQYMKNVAAPKSEATFMYNGYTSEAKEKEKIFYIPVYDDMPSSNVKLPTSINNEELNNANSSANETEKNTLNISEIVNGSGYIYNNGNISKIGVNTTPEQLKNNLQALSGEATININSNGKSILGTGDTVTINNNGKNETLTVVIYGDINGDGKISIADLVKVQKHLLNTANLSGIYGKAGDTNKDGKISIVDLVKIQKTLLGTDSISQ